MTYLKTVFVFLSVLLLSSLMIPIDDVFATTSFVDAFYLTPGTPGPFGLAFSNDGFKMFVSNFNNNNVNEYTLTSAFDVSTASFVDGFDASPQVDPLTGLAFSNDGFKMFVTSINNNVYEYTLTSAFDVSTASFVDAFDVSPIAPRSVAFSNDGFKMFVSNFNNNNVYEYTLTSAFDVSTASFVDGFDASPQVDFLTGLAFSNDGFKMFVVDGDRNNVYEYTLTSAFDVSTASFVDAFDVSPDSIFSTGLAFSNDGLKMFVANFDTGFANYDSSINEYTLEVAWDLVLSLSSATNEQGNGGCSGDCTSPTLGIDENGRRIVTDGFTYNGKSVDVELFFTPYPLITVNVGEPNLASFKIFENSGPDAIKHFSFAFGLAKDQIISQSKAMIELDIDHEGTETVTITDPQNALDDVKVETIDRVDCNGQPEIGCLQVNIYHTFRAPLDFDIVATDVWDKKRNSWQNYYNHGIHVQGDSLNPPELYDGIHKGHLYHLTETGKGTAVDIFGNSWTFDKIWVRDYIKQQRIVDPDTDVFTRTHSEFAKYKDAQAIDAINQLLVICPTCMSLYDDFASPINIDYPDRTNKLDNLEIQKNMIFESERAQKVMDIILDSNR